MLVCEPRDGDMSSCTCPQACAHSSSGVPEEVCLLTCAYLFYYKNHSEIVWTKYGLFFFLAGHAYVLVCEPSNGETSSCVCPRACPNSLGGVPEEVCLLTCAYFFFFYKNHMLACAFLIFVIKLIAT